MPLEHLEARICELAGHIAAATCQFLVLLADFDAREGWREWEMPSCAAWLSWKCQMAPGTAKDHVRLARALTRLPVTRGELAAGRISYSKARALARIATPETERDLAGMAASMTAGQVERFAAAHRKCSPDSDGPSPRREQKLTWRLNDDGTITFTAAFRPEDGAVILQALRASRDDLDHPHSPATQDARFAAGEPERVPAGDLADALADVCASYLQAKITTADNADVYQVIIHAGAAAVTGGQHDTDDQPRHAPAEPGGGVSAETLPEATTTPAEAHPAWLDRCHIEDGPAITPAALQLIGCTATISTMVHRADGTVLAVGRRTRKPPAALRRAVRERDHYRCRFPGCESRRVDLHHIRHWANGGPTSRDNLICLCRRHHAIVHDKGYTITSSGQFHARDGHHIPHNPPLPNRDGDITTAHDAAIAYHTIVPPYSGERLNLHYAISVCLDNAEAARRRARMTGERLRPVA
jgi:5-methylcytosine-specific restriction endonuclease McrA